jgi:beta-phosphoglucomutase-like phosphatase (HAD superfamily)
VHDLLDVRVDGVLAEDLGLAGKPDPAMLVEAASRLTGRPDRCVVIEDAEAGELPAEMADSLSSSVWPVPAMPTISSAAVQMS